MSKNIELVISLTANNQASAAVKDLQGKFAQLRDVLSGANGLLKQFTLDNRLLTQFETARQRITELQPALVAARDRLQELQEKVKIGDVSTKEFLAARNAAQQLEEKYAKLRETAAQMRGKLAGAGHDVSNSAAIANSQAGLSQRIQAAGRIGQLNQQRVAMQDKGLSLMANGQLVQNMGAGTKGFLDHATDGASEYQTNVARIRALGMGSKTAQSADIWARRHRQAGVSMGDNIDIMRDGLAIFADLHHAEMAAPTIQKMMFANKAMYGEKGGAKTDQLYQMMKVIELRGGATNAEKFKYEANMIQKVLSATGGRVGPDEYRNLIQTGGTAAKGLKDDVFYNVLEPMVQEMGGHAVGTSLMTAYQNLYVGRTKTANAMRLLELGLIDPSQVEYDKAGRLKRMKPGGLTGASDYVANPLKWFDDYFLPALTKKGIDIKNQEAVFKEISGVVGDRNAAKLFTTYYQQRETINKSAEVNRKAMGIDDITNEAYGTNKGKQLVLDKNWEDLRQQIGEKLLPTISKFLDRLNAVLECVNRFATENPRLTETIATVVSIFALATLVVGGLALGIGALLAPFALLKFAVLALVPSLVAANIAMLPMLVTIGAIVLAVGIVVAAFVYWDDIMKALGTAFDWLKEKAGKVWTAISEYFSGWGDALSRTWEKIKVWWATLDFAQMGLDILRGIGSGIMAGINFVLDPIKSIADRAVAKFKDVLGIRSPSRVFEELGLFTTEGLGLGIESGAPRVLQTLRELADRVVIVGAGALAAGVVTAVPMQSFGVGTSPTAPGGAFAPITININGAGLASEEIARAVRREIETMQRSMAHAHDSRMFD